MGGVPGKILEDYPALEAVDVRAWNAGAHAGVAADTLAAVAGRGMPDSWWLGPH